MGRPPIFSSAARAVHEMYSGQVTFTQSELDVTHCETPVERADTVQMANGLPITGAARLPRPAIVFPF
jgi:hypothetical protein